MYRAHMLGIKQKDLALAMDIVLKHESDFDKITRSVYKENTGETIIIFKFHPFVYEDFEKIRDEFIKAGIQTL